MEEDGREITVTIKRWNNKTTEEGTENDVLRMKEKPGTK